MEATMHEAKTNLSKTGGARGRGKKSFLPVAEAATRSLTLCQ